jgi:hypothetical protein
MCKDGKENTGVKNLLSYYRGIFRTPENLDHYSGSDLDRAERKFLKYILFGRGPVNTENPRVK